MVCLVPFDFAMCFPGHPLSACWDAVGLISGGHPQSPALIARAIGIGMIHVQHVFARDFLHSSMSTVA
jgi:hypothetical protein